ncbi:hypothetical protein ACIPIX_04950 [Pseudomonas protegens]|uniref:hypothetical protein n=1 Tax=Pseudomonas protegens TaxID=380021 RepID=UPI00381A46D5
MNLKLYVFMFFYLFVGGCSSVEPTDWKRHIDWARKDSGAPDCIAEYTFHKGGPECLAIGFGGGTGHGNRQCLMGFATNEAYRNCDSAYAMVLTTQCHNGAAQRDLKAAGPEKVCAYLKEKK